MYRNPNHIESYIDNTIETPKNTPTNILTLLKQLEKYDKEGNDVLYYDTLDNLWVLCKNAVAAKVMTYKDWDTIDLKYWIHADIVMKKEEENENI